MIPTPLLHVIFAVVCLVLPVHMAIAGNYFISQDGDDNNTGLSWRVAWETLGRAAKQAHPGDTIVIRKGVKPYIHLHIERSGTAENPIVFRGEDPNDPPVISAAIMPDEWTKSGITGVWKYRAYLKTTQVKEDNILLAQATSEDCTDGQWFWSDNTLYYRPSTGKPGDHMVWRGRGGGINVGKHSWIELSDLKLIAGMGSGVSIRGGSHNKIRNLHVKWHWRGLNIHGGNYNHVENCVVEGNREGIYLQSGASFNVVRNCRAVHNGTMPFFNDGDRHAIAIGGFGSNRGNTVSNCEIAFNGGPPEAVALIAFAAPDTLFENNHVHDNYGSGLAVVLLSDGTRVSNNIIENNGMTAVKEGQKGIFGLTVRGSKDVLVSDNRIIGNHVSPDSRYGPRIHAGPKGGIDVREAGPRRDMGGIIIRNNVVTETRGGPDIYISSFPHLSDIIIEPRSQMPDWLSKTR